MNKGWLIGGIVAAAVGTVLFLATSFVTAAGDETRPGMRAYRALAKRGLVPGAQLPDIGYVEAVRRAGTSMHTVDLPQSNTQQD